jgi:hypothetical protein
VVKAYLRESALPVLLAVAQSKADAEVVAALLDAGIDVNADVMMGQRALDLA